MAADFLVPQEKYLEAGAHIGTRNKNGGMREFIYKARDDGLHVLDLKKLDTRIRLAALLLARYDPAKVFVVSSKENAQQAISELCILTGFQGLGGRFTPGRFTNPARPDFVEPEIVLVVDPGVDKQSVREAFTANIPVIALCDTNNNPAMVDLIVPTNNKGRKAIAFVFWLIAREVLKKRGTIASNEDYTAQQEDFEAG